MARISIATGYCYVITFLCLMAKPSSPFESQSWPGYRLAPQDGVP